MRGTVRACRALALVALAALVLFVAPVSARAVPVNGVFIPLPGVRDVEFSSAEHLLFMSAGDQVWRYQADSNVLLQPSWPVSGSDLQGMDLSPDGATLAIADGTSTDETVGVRLLDAVTGAESPAVVFPRAAGETGTYSVAYLHDGQMFTTSIANESLGRVPMRRYDPATGSVTILRSVYGGSLVTADGSGSKVGWKDLLGSSPFGTYGSLGESMVAPAVSYPSWGQELALNDDGTRIVTPGYWGCNGVFDASGSLVDTFSATGMGAAFRPRTNDVYLPRAGSSEVVAYDADTGALLGARSTGHRFAAYNSGPLYGGRIKFSQDGLLVAATFEDGVWIGPANFAAHGGPAITWVKAPSSVLSVKRSFTLKVSSSVAPHSGVPCTGQFLFENLKDDVWTMSKAVDATGTYNVATGRMEFTRSTSIPTAGVWRVSFSMTGDDVHDASISTAKSTLAGQTTISISASRKTVRVRGAVVITGRLRDLATGAGIKGQTVQLDLRLSKDVDWSQNMKSTKTGSGGYFRIVAHPFTKTYYRVTSWGSSKHLTKSSVSRLAKTWFELTGSGSAHRTTKQVWIPLGTHYIDFYIHGSGQYISLHNWGHTYNGDSFHGPVHERAKLDSYGGDWFHFQIHGSGSYKIHMWN